MAGAFVSNASSSSVPLKNYEVFISFRGEDTRANFTTYLHAALRRKNIGTYTIDKDDEVWAELARAIKDSNLFLVIFSENYASSTRCLNELVEIMDCRKNGEDVDVIPVFYNIEPSQVRKQSGSYKKALEKHKKDSKHRKEKMQKWKEALYEAANLSGFDSHTYRVEADLIEDIVKAVLRKLNYKYTNELRGLFISDENYTHIESLLKVDLTEVKIIGIWGMGGIGKTTLAAAIFHKVSFGYDGTCFLENVAEESKRYGLNYIFNRLLSKLLREDLHIDTPKVIPSSVTRKLRRKKVFIILDDVNTSELLENLVGVGRDWLGAESRVIVTTRDKHVLMKGGVDEIYEVKEMNFQNSLLLFSMNAFNKTFPKQEYEEVSKQVVVYAKGIPLALKVLGSLLRSKGLKEWDSVLTKLKKIPNAEIQKVLRLSYEELDEAEQNIFLDIACFLKGRKIYNVIEILNACCFFADIGIRNLLDKALITIDLENCVSMHDLIQEVGREIVCEESIGNPERRSRLWDPKEVCDVLINNRGTSAIEGILLDTNQVTNINLSSKAFRKMPNLRLLAFETFKHWELSKRNSVHLPSGLELLPKNLRYFGWDGYPLKSLPSKFCPEKLVELSLPCSNVEKLWDGEQHLPNLEKIDLSNSKRLIECPDLSCAPNVKYIRLNDCASLSHVDPLIFSLQKLEELKIDGCISLKSLSSNTCSPSIKRLYASDCYNLQEFSVPFMPTDPFCLNFGSSSLNELPSSILNIRNLENFTFPISDGLVDLPEKFANQITLTESRKQKRDTVVTLSKALHSLGFQCVRRLLLINCPTLYELPDSISLLSSLENLRIFYSAVVTLPESLKYLPRLNYLEVDECTMLQSIPALPPTIQCFCAWNCESLQTLLTSTSEPSKKYDCTFLLCECLRLDQHSSNTIMKDAIVRIELGAKLLSEEVLENEEDASLDDNDDDDDDDDIDDGGEEDDVEDEVEDDDFELYTYDPVRHGKVCYFLPARSDKLRDWFHHHSAQPLFTIELPPNLLGFVFYLVVSPVQSCQIGYYESFGCECYMETSWGEMINITSFFVDKRILVCYEFSYEMMSDHLFLWYDAQCCKQIMEAVKERKDINVRSIVDNRKVTFKFFTRKHHFEDNKEAVIKECGLRWIYPSEDQIIEEEEGFKSNNRRDIHELEVSAIQNSGEGSKSIETITSIEKFKQRVLETLSSQEAEDTKDLRGLLEELLHIGFGGDFMQ